MSLSSLLSVTMLASPKRSRWEFFSNLAMSPLAKGADLCSRFQSSNVQILFSNPNGAGSAFHPLGQQAEFCVVYFRRFSYEPLRSSRLLIEDFPPHFPRALTFIPDSSLCLDCENRALGKRGSWRGDIFPLSPKSLNPREHKT